MGKFTERAPCFCPAPGSLGGEVRFAHFPLRGHRIKPTRRRHDRVVLVRQIRRVVVVDRWLPTVGRPEEQIPVRHVPGEPRLHALAIHRRPVARMVVSVPTRVIPQRSLIVFSAGAAPVPQLLALLTASIVWRLIPSCDMMLALVSERYSSVEDAYQIT